jgi:16S rRNA (guanine1207-N2)-methyltransferase
MPPDPPEVSHYFTSSPAVRSAPGSVRLTLPDVSCTLATDRGVFAREAIDPGTKLLLLEGPRPAPEEKGALLDLGCGYGPIAVTLARRAPGAHVWAIDVNERARELCRRNAEACTTAGRVTVAHPDEVPEDLRFAGIWSNPPIRVGKKALHELLLRWLSRLQAGASATLVVNKNLGADSLASWLDTEGWPNDRLASRSGYRVLGVRRGDHQSPPAAEGSRR